MILSKTNLMVVGITKDDKQIPALNNIFIRQDGTTIGANGNVVICVSPITKEVRDNVVITETQVTDDTTIPSEMVNDVIKNIPPDKMFKGLLEHCDFRNSETHGFFTVKDGKKTRTLSGLLYRHGYIPFKKILKRILQRRTGNRVILNLQRLLSLLTTVNKMCPDASGDSPVFIEFTEGNNILVRAVNKLNGQRVLGVMTSYKTEDENWLQMDEWEKSFLKKEKDK